MAVLAKRIREKSSPVLKHDALTGCKARGSGSIGEYGTSALLRLLSRNCDK
jgi:hypothetical protein